ncbi:threonine aldolase [Rickenella mellea]|uniref:Threonine aldolase n=1 Tax=Rickenella mellea TaxID=50990 RepID=A0A4Y7QM59_9AGAM|nr:threonine aldolase [Rickenella mellea]
MDSQVLNEARSRIADDVRIDIIGKTQHTDNDRARLEISRSFVSDTITAPSREMYAYAINASLGDDVYHEPTTAALEAHVARLTGKEAGLFLPSGAMSNQIALRTHLKQPPYSVLCDHRSHIYKYEAGGAAFHSGAATIATIPSNRHHLTLKDVKEHVVIGSDVHFAPTEVIALENTLNGTIFPQDEILAISGFAQSQGMKMHLDGARIWHVAAETATPLKDLCEPFDSVSLCFSKGLGAPVGSCLVGSREFIQKARWLRKLFGGGMRQTGILSASAAYALSFNFPRLPEVHALARKLEAGLRGIGVEITSEAETCMVFFDPSRLGLDFSEISESAASLENPIKVYGSRLVVHIQTTPEAVDDLLSLIKKLADEKAAAGFVPPSKPETNGVPKDVYVRAGVKPGKS